MEKSIIESEQKLNLTIDLLSKIVRVGNSAQEKFPQAHYEIIVFVFIGYLERLTASLDSINILLQQYKDKPYIETSIGLIIRASLLDYMTMAYMSTFFSDIKSKDDTEGEIKFQEKFNALICDQIHNTFKYLKLTKSSNLISQEDYNSAIENCYKNYHFAFIDDQVDYDHPEQKLICTKFVSPRDMFTRIHNHPLTKKYSKVYDLYIYYSKYEHYGIMTHFMQNQGFDNNFSRIILSIKYIIRGIGATFAFLDNPKDKLIEEKKQLNILEEKFGELS
jgi:hypothetical protein